MAQGVGAAVRTWLADPNAGQDKTLRRQKSQILNEIMNFDVEGDDKAGERKVAFPSENDEVQPGSEKTEDGGYVGSMIDETKRSTKHIKTSSGRRFAWIGDHKRFAIAVQTMILLNSLQMGLETALEGEPFVMVWTVLEHFFTAFFLVEVIIRVYCDGYKYVTDPHDRPWNALDVVVVTVSVVDAWVLSAIGSNGGSMTVLKILRLARLLRVLKLLREYKALMLLIESILGSLKPMAWLAAMLSILIYAFSIFCVHAIGRSEAYPEGRGPADSDEYPPGTENLELLFGDLGIAMFVLSGLALGHRAKFILKSLFSFQPYLLPLMYAYMMIVMFGLLNAMIGIVCQKTKEACQETERLEELDKQASQKEVVDKLKTIMYKMDVDGDGTVSQAELQKAGKNPTFTNMLGKVDLPAGFRLEDVHLMLDKDGDGELTEEEFADGMYDLISGNSFQRQCILMRSVAQGKRAIFDFRADIAEEFQSLRKSLDLISGKTQPESSGDGHRLWSIAKRKSIQNLRSSRKSSKGESLWSSEADGVQEAKRFPPVFEDVKGTWEPLSSDIFVEASALPTVVGQPIAEIGADVEKPSTVMEREPRSNRAVVNVGERQARLPRAEPVPHVEASPRSNRVVVNNAETQARFPVAVPETQVDDYPGTLPEDEVDNNQHAEAVVVSASPGKKVADGRTQSTRICAMQMAAAKYGGRAKTPEQTQAAATRMASRGAPPGSRPPTRKQIAAARTESESAETLASQMAHDDLHVIEASQMDPDDLHMTDVGETTDVGSDNEGTCNSSQRRRRAHPPGRVVFGDQELL